MRPNFIVQELNGTDFNSLPYLRSIYYNIFFSKNILNANAALIKTYETVESVVYASDDNLIVQKDDDLEEMIGVEEDEETAQYPLQQVIEEVVLEDQIQYIIS